MANEIHSIPFDRAASFYERTRAIPPEAMAQVADFVMNLARADSRAPEVGVGTGRITRPLMARGLQTAGIDLSRPMMDVMRELLPSESGLEPMLVQGSASELPFQSSIFDLVLAVHVFHLIQEWRQALAEVQRVLKPHGVFLHSPRLWQHPAHVRSRIRERFTEIAAASGYVDPRPGTRNREALNDELGRLGAQIEVVPIVEWKTEITARQELDSIRRREQSALWFMPDRLFEQAMEEVEQWAADEIGSLDEPQPQEHRFSWHVIRFS